MNILIGTCHTNFLLFFVLPGAGIHGSLLGDGLYVPEADPFRLEALAVFKRSCGLTERYCI